MKTQKQYFKYFRDKYGKKSNINFWVSLYWRAYKQQLMTLEEIEKIIVDVISGNKD